MPKLTPSQRRAIFCRWLEGNRIFTAGGRPETMREIGKDYGVSAAAVNWIVRNLGGPGNRRPGSVKPSTCREPTCDLRAWAKGRCRRHYERWRYQENATNRARVLQNQVAYRERRRSSEAKAARSLT